jgi:cytochrome b561
MTPIENTEDRYGAVAILFHWSMALLVIGLAALGLYMVTLPDVGFNTNKVTLVLYHKEFGLLVLVLLATRLA